MATYLLRKGNTKIKSDTNSMSRPKDVPLKSMYTTNTYTHYRYRSIVTINLKILNEIVVPVVLYCFLTSTTYFVGFKI